jgi:hypothetical protein
MFNSFSDALKHPVVALRFRRDAVADVREKLGVGRIRARQILDDASDAEVAYSLNAACEQSGLSAPPELAALVSTGDGVGAIGDGTIIQAIRDFFKAHPEILKIAVAILLSFIGL